MVIKSENDPQTPLLRAKYQFFNDPSIPQILSMGWGVQTFGVLVMIKEGILPKPDLIIHADTKAEKPETEIFKKQIGIPLIEELGIEYVELTNKQGIYEEYLSTNNIPIAGFASCTDHFKIRPIRNYLKQRYERSSKPYYQVWVGISIDEAKRAISKKEQSPKYHQMIYPLLDLNFTRREIKELIEANGYEIPPKSGCFICPYQGLRGFLEIKTKHPDLFDKAVIIENAYFEGNPEREFGFLQNSQIRLQTLKDMKSLFSYELIENDQNECESGGCFL